MSMYKNILHAWQLLCTPVCVCVCLCVFARMRVESGSTGTHFVCVCVYTAVFQLSEWIRLSRANKHCSECHTHTHTHAAWNGYRDCAKIGSVWGFDKPKDHNLSVMRFKK